MIRYYSQQFGNYRALRQLGEGGFADVYLAEHIQIGKRAAIKVFKNRMSAYEQPNFLKEGRMLAALEHPHITQVFDCGVVSTNPFLVMNYASGGSLRDRYPKRSRLFLQSIVLYITQAASALQYAHNKGIIHCDVKPENLLLNEHSDLLVSDFGIALFAQTMRTRPQEVGGTWAYTAPEQFKGMPCFASDQYSLAVIAYEWLSGNQPFQGSSQTLLFQHLQVPPPPFRQHGVEVPPAVEQVVMKALAKKPEERFPTIQSFATALALAIPSVYQLSPYPPAPAYEASFPFYQSGTSSVKTFATPSQPALTPIPKIERRAPRHYLLPTILFAVLALLIATTFLLSIRY